MLIKNILIIGILIVLSGFSQSMAREVVSITGAGPSIDIVNKFFFNLREEPWVEDNYLFRLDPISTKHAGGIENSDRNLFGRTGRPLSSDEKALGKSEILLAKIPIVFITNHPIGINEITLDEFKSVYERRIKNWSQLGGLDIPIVLIGREKRESVYSLLKQKYPFLKSVQFDVVLHTDTAVVNFLKYTDRNCFTFGSAPNLNIYNIIHIKGMNVFRTVGLVYDLKNETHPLVKKVISKANSKQWKNRVLDWGYQPVSK